MCQCVCSFFLTSPLSLSHKPIFYWRFNHHQDFYFLKRLNHFLTQLNTVVFLANVIQTGIHCLFVDFSCGLVTWMSIWSSRTVCSLLGKNTSINVCSLLLGVLSWNFEQRPMVPRRRFLVTFGNPLTLGFHWYSVKCLDVPLITRVITGLLLWNHEQFKLFIQYFDFVVEKLRISVLCCDNKVFLLIIATSFIKRRKTLHESHKIGPRHIRTALWGALGLSEQTISPFHKRFPFPPCDLMWECLHYSCL